MGRTKLSYKHTPQEAPSAVAVLKNRGKDLSGFNILTMDPSLTAWGWAVISSNGEILECGVVKTENKVTKLRIRAGDDRTRRISELTDVLVSLMRKWNIKYILSELPHGAQNYNAAVMVGMVPGIVETMSKCFDVGVEWYSEADSKKALLGKSSATKMETMERIDDLYHIPLKGGISRNRKGEVVAIWSADKETDEAVADAISVYHVARKQSNILKFHSR